MSRELLFKLADLFGGALHVAKSSVRGSVSSSVSVGGVWKIPVDATLAVDENSPKLLTAFMRIRKNLWAYVVVTSAGQWMLFFDNDHTKIKLGGEALFGTGSGMKTLARLKSAVTGAVAFDGLTWVPADALALVEGL